MRTTAAALLVAWAAMIAPACAQAPAGRPYAPLTATYDRAAADDPGFVAALDGLRAAVAARDTAAVEAMLSPKFVALDCAADPLKACGPGKAKAIGGRGRALDRLRLGFCCDGKPAPDMPETAQNDTMFAVLAADLEAGAPGANPDAKGMVCAPALPRFDRAKASAAAKAAGVEPENLRFASRPVVLRERPSPDAPAAAGLEPGALAPLVTDLTANTPAGWNAVGLPDGSIGFTDALGLDELTPAAICFGREKDGWRIVAAIQRGG